MKEQVTQRKHSTHRNSLQPGYELYWYRIEKILGQGAFAITYLATDLNLNLKVAIKEFFPTEFSVRDRDDFSVHPMSDQYREKYEWGLERFISEARTLTNFNHPNIVRVMSVFEEKNTAYMVMAYEEGDSLKAVLDREGLLTEIQSKRIVLSILDGLEHVHNAGFIHRDIKPANIFIREDGSPVLIDFGSARHALGSRTRTLTGFASPGYAPFEQYSSKSDKQGPWTDIYGLGATLYRAVAGMLPMDAISRSQGILKGSNDMLLPASELCKGKYSDGFLRAIDHALEFHEHDRPQDVRQWMEELLDGRELPEESDSTEWVKVVNREGEKESIPQITNEKRDHRETEPKSAGVSIMNVFVMVCIVCVAWAGWHYRNQIMEQLREAGIINEAGLIAVGESEAPVASEEPAVATAPAEEQPVALGETPAVTQAEPEMSSSVEPESVPEPEQQAPTTEAIANTEGEVEQAAGQEPVAEPDQELKQQQAVSAETPENEVLETTEATPATPVPVAGEVSVAESGTETLVDTLLAEAQADLEASRLNSPADENALDRFRKVLELDGENQSAKDGIQSVLDTFIQLAGVSLEKSEFGEVEAYLAAAEDIDPDAESIKNTRQQLVATKARAAANAKFTQFVARAKSALTEGRISSPPGENAIELFQKANQIKPGSGVVRKGYIDVGNVLIKLADDASYGGNYSQAYAYLDQAKILLPDREEIDAARKYVTERQQRRRQADARERELQAAKEKIEEEKNNP